ncbi:MAG: transglycosylase SLT domain-containing protein [Sphingomonadales bacterium]|nr:transglycosylase SLT domain-containing protein [Sphingomonadales bacterium]
MSQGDFPASATGPGAAWAAAGAPAPGDARAAIARAAQATGVDFSYLLAQARLESSLNPSARAGTSSAAGLYQFTQGTWAQMLQQHGSEIGLDAALPGGTLAALRDPGQRARLMALRFDPDTSARMAAELAGDNQAALGAALGRPPRPGELYLAHFLGSDGAVRFLSALGADPTQSAAALLPKAAAANRAVFYDAAGAPRSVGAVMAMLDQRMSAAMQDGNGMSPADVGALAASTPATAPIDNGGFSPAWAGNLGREFASAQARGTGSAGDGNALPRPAASMADTLNATFGLADAAGAGGSTPEFVRSAYGRLRALGL